MRFSLEDAHRGGGIRRPLGFLFAWLKTVR
jgi:hypothetical protein